MRIRLRRAVRRNVRTKHTLTLVFAICLLNSRVCCSCLLPRRRRLVRGCVNRARPHNKLQCSPFVLHDTCEAEPAYLLTQTPRHGISHTPFDQTRCARECACGCCSCVFVLVSGLLFRVPASAPVCVFARVCDPPGRLNVVDDAWHKRACVWRLSSLSGSSGC